MPTFLKSQGFLRQSNLWNHVIFPPCLLKRTSISLNKTLLRRYLSSSMNPGQKNRHLIKPQYLPLRQMEDLQHGFR